MPIGTSANEYFEDSFSANHSDFLPPDKNTGYQGSSPSPENRLKGLQGPTEATPSGTRQISIIRHGATKMNNDDVSVDRIRGWNNIPLSEEGKQEAERLGEKMNKDTNKPEVLVTSDLHRASETAHIISKKTGIPVSEETQGLRPWNVGELAGQVSKHAVPILADYATKKPDEKVPGGESFNDFKDRFMGTLNDILEKHDGRVGIVTHHRGERLMKAWEAKGFPSDGTIDHDTFTQKGDHTGAKIDMEVPAEKIQVAGRAG
jgi:probable phosphoglycerate mutase